MQNAGPDIQWIEGQRTLFTVAFHLDSTVHSTDQHLHNLFDHIDRVMAQTKPAGQRTETETCKVLKAAHAVHVTSVITFLPTLLNQLFQLLVHTASEEIGLHVIRLLVHLVHMVAAEAGRKELLAAYVKYVFKMSNKRTSQSSLPFATAAANTTSDNLPTAEHTSTTVSRASSVASSVASSSSSSPSSAAAAATVVRTVHGEMCRHLAALLHPNNTDFLIVNKFMQHAGIFFDIIVKSIAQHLLGTGRIRMLRNERLPADFATSLESLVEVSRTTRAAFRVRIYILLHEL